MIRYTPNEVARGLDRAALNARSDRAIASGGTAVNYNIHRNNHAALENSCVCCLFTMLNAQHAKMLLAARSTQSKLQTAYFCRRPRRVLDICKSAGAPFMVSKAFLRI
eukprot:2821289-Pleurochrysis_carterae.AAC.2